MKTLREIQLAFSAAVLWGNNQVPDAVAAPPTGNRLARFDIYREGYRQRLIESLATDYPATRAMLGADRFAALARSFAETHPSPYFNLRWYGAEFAEFALSSADSDRALIAALATFEWAVAGAFDAADAAPITADDIAHIPPASWPHLIFELHPSIRQLALPTRVPKLWKAATAGEPLPTGTTWTETDVSWLVWRKDLGVLFRQSDTDEAEALQLAAAAATFAQICVGLSAHMPDAQTPARAAALLRRWVGDGLITGVRGSEDLPPGSERRSRLLKK